MDQSPCAATFGLYRYAKGLALSALSLKDFAYSHHITWEWKCSMAVLVSGVQLQIWIFVAGFQNCCGLRRSFNREMPEDRIIMWRFRDEFWLCWRKSQNDPWFREVKILLKLFMFHTFYLPKWCGKNLSHGKSSLSSFMSLRMRNTPYPVYKSLYIRLFIPTLLTKFRLCGLITESHKRLQAKLGNKQHWIGCKSWGFKLNKWEINLKCLACL